MMDMSLSWSHGSREKRTADRAFKFFYSVEFAIWRWIRAGWLRRPAPTAEVLVWIPGAFKFILSWCSKIGVWKRWRWYHELYHDEVVSWWCRQLALPEHWGDWGCQSSGTAVCWRLLRMGGDSLLRPVWRSVGGWFIRKGELDFWVVRVVTWRPQNFSGMGAGWAGMVGGSANGLCLVHLSDRCGLVSGRGGEEKIVGCSVWKGKCIQG